MMGNVDVEANANANAKVPRGGIQQLYTTAEKQIKKNLAPGSLGNSPPSSTRRIH
jgi:hypothetical protein